MSTGTLRPTRYAALDVLRGTAILGTLATNIWIFTDPEGLIGYINGTGGDGTPAPWALTEDVLQQLAQGKFLGLLTLMFGIGLEIQRRSAVRAGRPWPGRYPWRASLLFLDGLLNFLLVIEFDVLMGYALTGFVVAYVLATSERAQRRVCVLAGAVHLLVLTMITVAFQLSPVPASAPPALDPNPYAEGSWWDLVLFRIDNVVLFRLETVFILPMSVALFLLGARLLRSGVLEPRGERLRRRLLVLGSVAVVADLTLGLALEPAGIIAARYGTAPLVALGLLALVVEIVRRRPDAGPVRNRLADVGRMALSCYVLQNLVAGAICYGWGLGLAAAMSPGARVPGTLALYLVVVVIISAFARLWLRRFSRGPLELAWLWCFQQIDRRLPARAR
ncbi:DUF418 domain-containing protein [Microlunatus aurantiacus]|uniref:DUF418 domain-containing protein n=1 Tax=Microlunatus aurantiacus TaxID=446786 RepID=A0ABP7D3Q0_9ACTN